MSFDEAAFSAMESLLKTQGHAAALEFVKAEFPNAANDAITALNVCNAFHAGRKAEALDAFLAAQALPEQALSLAILSAVELRRQQEMARPIFSFAEKAVEAGHCALAMEMVKKIYNTALSGKGAEFLVGGERLMEVSALLERIAQTKEPRSPEPASGPKSKPRIALVSINMLEGVSAYAKRAAQFARCLDRSRFDCYEYFTEETLTVRKQHAMLKMEQPSSEENAPKALAAMRASGATVKLIPPELDWLEAALWLAEEMERDAIDGAIFQGGVASPIMWVASRLAQTPMKMTLCVGVNMFQKGQAATIYMGNRANLERDASFWRPEWGRQILLEGGVDVEEAASARPLKRRDYAIPEDAVAFGFLSNYPAERATPIYMECVGRILKACPQTLFVCMGPGRPMAQMDFMQRHGLASRCRWLLWQHPDSFASLKLLDFYCNEFPVGGAQVVLESMACGVPAIALPWSDKHAECAGAQMLGPDFATPKGDVEAYVAHAIEWTQSPALRKNAAQAQFERAKEKFNARDFINKLAELALELKPI